MTERNSTEGLSTKKQSPIDDSIYEHSKSDEGSFQRGDLPSLSSLFGLGAAAVTSFSVMTSFFLHLMRSIEYGYPLFLAQISAADIVPVLPTAIGALLAAFPGLLGFPRLISDFENILSNWKDSRKSFCVVIASALGVVLAVLLPIIIFIIILYINVMAEMIYTISTSVIWLALLVRLVKKEFGWACRSVGRDVVFSKSGCSSEAGRWKTVSSFVSDLAYVGLSIFVCSFFGAIIQAAQPPAPLVVLGVVLLLALYVLVALLLIAPKKQKTPLFAPNNRVYLYYFACFSILLASVTTGVLMASPALSGGQRYVVVCEKAADDNGAIEEPGVEYPLLDTFANGNAIVSVNDNENGEAKSYKVISLTDGYSIKNDSGASSE